MRTKKASILTKLVVLALLAYLASALLGLQSKIAQATEEQAEQQRLVQGIMLSNGQLQKAVENSDDPAQIEDIARDKLGLVVPGEKVFVDVTN